MAKLKSIVGFEMAISTIEGKWKLSQNRSEADRQGVREGLEARRGPNDMDVLGRMAEDSGRRHKSRVPS